FLLFLLRFLALVFLLLVGILVFVLGYELCASREDCSATCYERSGNGQERPSWMLRFSYYLVVRKGLGRFLIDRILVLMSHGLPLFLFESSALNYTHKT